MKGGAIIINNTDDFFKELKTFKDLITKLKETISEDKNKFFIVTDDRNITQINKKNAKIFHPDKTKNTNTYTEVFKYINYDTKETDNQFILILFEKLKSLVKTVSVDNQGHTYITLNELLRCIDELIMSKNTAQIIQTKKIKAFSRLRQYVVNNLNVYATTIEKISVGTEPNHKIGIHSRLDETYIKEFALLYPLCDIFFNDNANNSTIESREYKQQLAESLIFRTIGEGQHPDIINSYNYITIAIQYVKTLDSVIKNTLTVLAKYITYSTTNIGSTRTCLFNLFSPHDKYNLKFIIDDEEIVIPNEGISLSSVFKKSLLRIYDYIIKNNSLSRKYTLKIPYKENATTSREKETTVQDKTAITTEKQIEAKINYVLNILKNEYTYKTNIIYAKYIHFIEM